MERRSRLQLIDREMSLAHLENGTWQSSFATTVPESYVPPIVDEHWPVNWLESMGEQTALIWLSYGLRAPTPHWIYVHHDERARLVVRLRPVMRLEADTYVLDQNGLIQRQQYYDDAGHPLGPTATSMVHVDRDTLLLKAPDARPLLDRLEAATKSHD